MPKALALTALLFFVPAFSIGVAASLFVAPGIIGNTIFAVIKVWAVVFPLLWTIATNPKALRFPKFEWQEIKTGLVLGALMFGTIALAYLSIGQQAIALSDVKAKATEVGLVEPYIYLIGCFYWSFVNSLIEECTWRGFVVSKCQVLFPKYAAVILAALFFTVHHSIALYGYTSSPIIVLLGSLGVFLAGIIWTWCYSHYQSIVPGYVSHILADLAIAIAGWQLLFT